MDTRSVPHHEDVEAHYASLERLGDTDLCRCYGGYHYIGHMVVGDDGDEVEHFDEVPCRRCRTEDR